ncbi:PH domain-containing protein [Rhodococcus rhodochrous J3]|uniref:PH domain-containing protein n=1 Tax=Rhodococcus rhodochrous J3 TaxID=903528 RepID=A0ABY1M7S5_RHORH|nr:PH domain-containing protein [Rhodococcus rhodochrous]SMG10911.1 PH domain-containing protein [Rhodococcus rhodochrous J3]
MTHDETGWDLEVRPEKMRRWVVVAAVVVMALHIFAALVLRGGGDTGVNLRVVDQIAILAIGVVLTGGVLLFTRPRLRAGADGVSVRNVVAERHIPWTDVRGLFFDHGAPWARLELPFDEYVPVVAIQARDGELAVDALERFRELESRYTVPDRNDGGAVRRNDDGGAARRNDDGGAVRRNDDGGAVRRNDDGGAVRGDD